VVLNERIANESFDIASLIKLVQLYRNIFSLVQVNVRSRCRY